jgi:hypothetical protein
MSAKAELPAYLIKQFNGGVKVQQRLTVPGSTYAEAWIEATFQIAWSRFALPPCTRLVTKSVFRLSST